MRVALGLDKVVHFVSILVRHPYKVWKGKITKAAFRIPTYDYSINLFVEQLYVAYPDPTIIIAGDEGLKEPPFKKIRYEKAK